MEPGQRTGGETGTDNRRVRPDRGPGVEPGQRTGTGYGQRTGEWHRDRGPGRVVKNPGFLVFCPWVVGFCQKPRVFDKKPGFLLGLWVFALFQALQELRVQSFIA